MEDSNTYPRIFLGIPIPDEWVKAIKKPLLEVYPELEKVACWTRTGNYHITIRFIGDLEENQITRLIKKISQSLVGFTPFQLQAQKIDRFPSLHSRLLAAEFILTDSMQTLFTRVERNVIKLGIQKEKRQLRPHMTLCRSAILTDKIIKPILLNNIKINITKMILYKSQQAQGGNYYLPLHHFTFCR